MKKITLMVIIGLLLKIFIIASSSSICLIESNSKSNLLYVGGTGTGNYSCIQDAIDNASNGDTVFVYNGTYYEHISIGISNLKLIGENVYKTIIDGRGIGRNICFRSGFNSSKNVNISRFTIKNASRGVVIDYSENRNKIINNIITECGIGITLLRGSEKTEINSNSISNNQQGIYIEGPRGLSPESRNNYILKNNFYNNQRNVKIDGSHNTFDSNYWDDWVGLKFKFLRFLPYNPYSIQDLEKYGIIWVFCYSFLNLDWNPSVEPYDIGE